VPAEFEVWLIDEALRVVQDLRSEPSYALAGVGEGVSKRLSLVVGKAGFLDGELMQSQEVPERTVLLETFPNPFQGATTIRYGLAEASPVRLVVYDVLGRAVATLVDGMQPAGSHEVRYEPGGGQPAGLYLYVLEAGGRRQARSMLLQ
jgi:hypothetical protein